MREVFDCRFWGNDSLLFPVVIGLITLGKVDISVLENLKIRLFYFEVEVA